MGKGPNDIGLSRKHILASVENSLKNLQTDYIGKKIKRNKLLTALF
jgi:aryl-alcohol dehydrogenase-like predicted oxidoreductase